VHGRDGDEGDRCQPDGHDPDRQQADPDAEHEVALVEQRERDAARRAPARPRGDVQTALEERVGSSPPTVPRPISRPTTIGDDARTAPGS